MVRLTAKKAFHVAYFAALLSLLAACEGTDTQDLEAYMAEVKSRQTGRIEPLPQFRPFESHQYESEGYRDPFEPWDDTAAAEIPAHSSGPGISRPREALEFRSLDSLRMVGTINKGGDSWALIQESDGTVHHVRPGNYLGMNLGRIDAIFESRVELTEVVPDATGGYMERHVKLEVSGDVITDRPQIPGGSIPKQIPDEVPVAADTTPVYNAIFDPHSPASPVALYDGKPTRILFFIGPEAIESAIPRAERALGPALQERIAELETDKLELTVTMNCWVCSTHDQQKRKIAYDPTLRRSDPAIFEVVPLLTAANPADGSGQITFTVAGDGVEYDHIVTRVFIGQTDQADEPVPAAPVQTAFTIPPDETRPDLVITVSQSPGGGVRASLEPVDAELRQRFEERHMADASVFRQFDTGVADTGALLLKIRETYVSLRALVGAKDDDLAQLSGITDIAASSDSIRVSEQLSEQLLGKIYLLGAGLYQSLFVMGDPMLLELMRAVEEYQPEGKVLRIKIVSKGIYLPWLILHPSESELDPNRFWGFRYELAVQPDKRLPVGRMPGEIKVSGSDEVLYLGYNAATPEDVVARLSAAFGDILKRQMGSETLVRVNTRDAFFTEFKQRARSVKLVLAFTHASSGTLADTTRNGAIVTLDDAAGVRLMLGPDDSISPSDILQLPFGEKYRSPYFDSQPIVFLNGCETGTTGTTPTTDHSFPGVLLSFGARGVIVTEAPVWNYLGYHLGKRMVAGMFEGKEMAAVLREARLWAWEKSNNPLGLIYSYYGNPAAWVNFR